MKFATAVVALAGVIILLGRPVQAAEPFAACAQQLPFGTPRLATEIRAVPVCHPGYAALVDVDALIPRWVSYRLTADHTLGCIKRTDDFHPEEEMSGGRRAMPADYNRSGFDRGHMAPAEDMAWSAPTEHDSFSMANMAPQIPGLNRAGWESIEEAVRAWAWERGELLVMTGPVLPRAPQRIGRDGIAVPAGFWKVLVDLKRSQAIGIEIPQAPEPKGNAARWERPVQVVERDAGITVPLARGMRDDAPGAAWASDPRDWRRARAAVCGGRR